RDAHRPRPLSGADGAGHLAAGPDAGAGPAAAVAAVRPPRPGNGLPEMSPQGTEPALHQRPGAGRGFTALAGGGTDPRAPRGTCGTAVALGETVAVGSRPERRCGNPLADGGGWYGGDGRLLPRAGRAG